MKYFPMVLVAIMTFLLVAACGGAKPTATPLPTSTHVPTAVPTPTKTAVPEAKAAATPPKLATSVGTPPAAGWKWVLAELKTEAGDRIEGPHDHDGSWFYYVVRGSTEISAASGKTIVQAGSAGVIPLKTEHSHRTLPNSHVVAWQLREADRPPQRLHGLNPLYLSGSAMTTAAATSYTLRIRELLLAPGEATAEEARRQPTVVYMVEGTVSIRDGQAESRIEPGNAIELPLNLNLVLRNASTNPVRFLLIDISP